MSLGADWIGAFERIPAISLQEQIQALSERLRDQLSGVESEAELDAVRVRFLGRSGEITTLRRGIGALQRHRAAALRAQQADMTAEAVAETAVAVPPVPARLGS